MHADDVSAQTGNICVASISRVVCREILPHEIAQLSQLSIAPESPTHEEAAACARDWSFCTVLGSPPAGALFVNEQYGHITTETRTNLEQIAKHLAWAVTVRTHRRQHRRAVLYAETASHLDVGLIWFQADGSELDRTPSATRLLSEFFAPHELLGPLTLPRAASGLLQAALRRRLSDASTTVLREGACSSLLGRMVFLNSRGLYVLQLNTRGLPRELTARLSPRRQKIAAALLRGLSNSQIARQEARSLATIKQQVEEVCSALGVHGRKGLLQLAAGFSPLD
ncbi:MAG: Bacterial regulatory protein luxR family [Pseudomonadota bacterium]|jgi:DNA-binding CsgD family transcriptional regulator